MHTCITKLVDDVIFAISFSSSTQCSLHKFQCYGNKYGMSYFLAKRKYKRKSSTGVVCWNSWRYQNFLPMSTAVLWWMWTSGKNSIVIISSMFSRRATSFKTAHQKDSETIQGDRQCDPQILNQQAKRGRTRWMWGGMWRGMWRGRTRWMWGGMCEECDEVEPDECEHQARTA